MPIVVNEINGNKLLAEYAENAAPNSNLDVSIRSKQSKLTDIHDVLVVSALPSSPESDILYLIPATVND